MSRKQNTCLFQKTTAATDKQIILFFFLQTDKNTL